jgi:hypothetical protein
LETQVLPVQLVRQALVKLEQQALQEIQVLPVQLVQLVQQALVKLARLETQARQV